MIIVDPITLGDTSFTRASPKWVYDRTGTLVQVPANILGVTYDPADLGKAPWALLEPTATNGVRNNTMQGGAVGQVGAGGSLPNNWQIGTNIGVTFSLIGKGNEFGIEYVDVRIFGTAVAAGFAGIYFDSTTAIPGVAGQTFVTSVFCIHAGGSTNNVASVQVCLDENSASTSYVTGSSSRISLDRQIWDGACRAQHARRVTDPIVAYVSPHIKLFNKGAGPIDIMLRIGLPQIERDRFTSPIKTSGSAVTRAADVVGSVAGLLYSNVPITEPDYSAAATYAKDSLVHDPVTHNVFKSLIDANKGKPLTDPAAWNPRGATNRWAMLDQYNNTQTSNPEEILIVLTPQAISEGLYIGNCEADEIELSVVDQSEGLVASAVTSLVTASGTSSYFDWCFRPADRSDYFVTTSMPPYANALVLVAIRKPGGVPKCGMLAIGAVDEFGPSLYGLSAEGKDYSSTTFNFDGTTNTEIRPYAKRMSVDVQVDNDEIDYIQRKLFQIRQRPIVWIGGPYGATAVFGRYGSFKIVIPGLKKSDMALQIEGSV